MRSDYSWMAKRASECVEHDPFSSQAQPSSLFLFVVCARGQQKSAWEIFHFMLEIATVDIGKRRLGWNILLAIIVLLLKSVINRRGATLKAVGVYERFFIKCLIIFWLLFYLFNKQAKCRNVVFTYREIASRASRVEHADGVMAARPHERSSAMLLIVVILNSW